MKIVSNQVVPFILFLNISLLFIGCKKNGEQNDSGFDVSVYKNNPHGIVASYAFGNLGFEFHGNFATDGNPEKISSFIVKKDDVVFNIQLDNKYRFQYLYLNRNGIKDTFFYHFTYLDATTFNVALLSQRWNNSPLVFHRSTTVKLTSGGSINLTQFGRGQNHTDINLLMEEGIEEMFTGIENAEQSFSSWVTDKKKSFFNTLAKKLKKGVDVTQAFTCAVTGAGIITAGIAPPVYIAATALCVGTTVFKDELKTNIDKGLGVKGDENFNLTTETPIPSSPNLDLNDDKIKIEKSFREFTLFSTDGWYDTGFDAMPSQKYIIEHRIGGWTVDRNSYAFVDADGHTNEASTPLINASALKTLQSAYFGALLGKIDNNIFKIGARYSGTLPGSGRLFIQINDNARNDNDGVIGVRITKNSN